LLADAAAKYGRDRASRMAAAIAYRTVFALAPLLILAMAILGWFLGSRTEAQAAIEDAIEAIAGPEVAELIGDVLTSALLSANTAALIGLVLLLWTASSLFLEMQRDLNDIFNAPGESATGIVAMVRTRGIGFLWVVGLGVVLIATWLLNAIWRYVGQLLPESLETARDLITVLTPLVSLLLLPVLFALIFQTMTVVRIPWRAVWVGGAFTAVVFLAASYGIGLWFQLFDPTTALGFAGSFVVVLFLAYFLAMVFLFGAEVTKVYSDRLTMVESEPSGAVVTSDPLVLVAAPREGLPRTVLLAFLAGLIAGWRRTRR
jgi:membrane protein